MSKINSIKTIETFIMINKIHLFFFPIQRGLVQVNQVPWCTIGTIPMPINPTPITFFFIILLWFILQNLCLFLVWYFLTFGGSLLKNCYSTSGDLPFCSFPDLDLDHDRSSFYEIMSRSFKGERLHSL